MSLSSLFSRTHRKSILVAGDFMLDTYTMGSVTRVSPEAPVIVVNAKKVTKLPGGAGNVVLNLVSLGAKVTALGRLGDDEAREDLLTALKHEKVATNFLYTQKGYQTPIKNRVMAHNQQIIRVDFEEKDPLSDALENKVIQDLPKILRNIAIVAISDYAKGFLSNRLLQALIHEANLQNVPVIVDPKGKDFTKYKGSFLIKPNLSEAFGASGMDEDAALEVVANTIYQQTDIPNIMITRSSEGITLFEGSKREDFAVKIREVTDVTGAGDTVLAVLTFALSNKIHLSQATILSNLAAGQVIEHLGCARISIKELAELILSQHLDNKVFSEKYLHVLQFILDHEDFVLLKISLEKTFSPLFFTHLKEIRAQYAGSKIVVYLEKDPEDKALIELLASLVEVDFIIKKSNNLQKFCQKHSPKKIFDYIGNKFETKKTLLNLG